jgi:hypothetical protein
MTTYTFTCDACGKQHTSEYESAMSAQHEAHGFITLALYDERRVALFPDGFQGMKDVGCQPVPIHACSIACLAALLERSPKRLLEIVATIRPCADAIRPASKG